MSKGRSPFALVLVVKVVYPKARHTMPDVN